MRLGTIDAGATTQACVVDNEGFAPIGEAGLYPDVAAVYAAGTEGRLAVERAGRGRTRIALNKARLRRPVLGDVAVICVGLNYRAHIQETGHEIPIAPTLFSKLPRALADPDAEIDAPPASDQLDYEGEFAVVIGTPGRCIAEDDAWDHVGGVTLINDISVRDYQRRSTQWFAGKSWQNSTPLGPFVVPAEDVAHSRLTVTVNGEQRQVAPFDDLVFTVPRLVADISAIIELRPGDIIATGTPGGVGMSLEPPQFLRAGDVVEVACEEIGSLTNRVRS